MIKRNSQILRVWFLCTDLAMTVAAWLAAYVFRFESALIATPHPTPAFELCWKSIPVVVLVAAVAYRLVGQYEIHRLRRLREEFVSIFQGAALMTLLVIAATFSVQHPYQSRATFCVFALFCVVFLLVSRRLSWYAIGWLRSHGYNQSHCVIVGTGRIARHAARAMRTASWMGLRNIGFIEDQPTHWTGDLDILGTTADLPALIAKYQVHHVFICLPMNRYDEARRVFDVLANSLIEVRLIADIPDLAGLSLTTANLDGLHVIGLRESPHFGLNVVVKRTIDIALSLIALLLLSPLMIGVALLVKLTSKGPILFRQERCGLNGQSFQMLKFRSMRVDAEVQTGAVWAIKDDPRRTPIGAFLRKTSLDELPQLINVLKGDMSLVGPRPERPVFIQKFSKTIPNYNARHCVKAGMTGWAQVHGWRGDTSLRKRVQYDLYYITHWTPWLDFRIMWMTVWHGLVHRNAY